MLSLSSSIPIWLCAQPTDMRKSFNGLMGVVQSVMQLDPLTGHLFVFRNKAGDKLKVLYWDCDGLAIWYKRLEKGTFQWLEASGPSLRIDAAQLHLLLDGIDVKKARRRSRYNR